MLRNVEIKAKVHNVSQILQLAEQLSGGPATILKQHDTFFKSNFGRLKLRRQQDCAMLLYYSRPDTEGPKLCDYSRSDMTLEQAHTLYEVLKNSLGVRGEVKKVRNLFMVGQTRVHVDQVEGLGDFMELEVQLSPEETIEKGQEIAEDLRQKLKVEKEDLLATAYMDILEKKI